MPGVRAGGRGQAHRVGVGLLPGRPGATLAAALPPHGLTAARSVQDRAGGDAHRGRHRSMSSLPAQADIRRGPHGTQRATEAAASAAGAPEGCRRRNWPGGCDRRHGDAADGPGLDLDSRRAGRPRSVRARGLRDHPRTCRRDATPEQQQAPQHLDSARCGARSTWRWCTA